ARKDSGPIPRGGGASRYRRPELRGSGRDPPHPGRYRSFAHQSRPADAQGSTQAAFESGGRMNCRSAESLFSSYIEDEISQEERRHLEAHLMGCRRCSLAIREVRATLSMLERMPLAEPSAHFDEDVYARIRSGEGLRPTVRDMILELLAPLRPR